MAIRQNTMPSPQCLDQPLNDQGLHMRRPSDESEQILSKMSGVTLNANEKTNSLPIPRQNTYPPSEGAASFHDFSDHFLRLPQGLGLGDTGRILAMSDSFLHMAGVEDLSGGGIGGGLMVAMPPAAQYDNASNFLGPGGFPMHHLAGSSGCLVDRHQPFSPEETLFPPLQVQSTNRVSEIGRPFCHICMDLIGHFYNALECVSCLKCVGWPS